MADPPREPPPNTTLKGIRPGPNFNNWYGYKLPYGTEVMPGDAMREGKANNWISGGGSGFKEWKRGFDPYVDYLQQQEDPQLQEFDLMSAMRDRLLRGE